MKEREDSIQEIMARLRAAKDTLGLKRIKYDPVAPVDGKRLNGIHIHVGKDETVKESSRTALGYPKVQTAQLVIEAWLQDGFDHVGFYQNFVQVVLLQPLSNKNTVRISGTFGPFDGNVPGAKVLQIFMDLQYVDYGLI